MCFGRLRKDVLYVSVIRILLGLVTALIAGPGLGRISDAVGLG